MLVCDGCDAPHFAACIFITCALRHGDKLSWLDTFDSCYATFCTSISSANIRTSLATLENAIIATTCRLMARAKRASLHS